MHSHSHISSWRTAPPPTAVLQSVGTVPLAGILVNHSTAQNIGPFSWDPTKCLNNLFINIFNLFGTVAGGPVAFIWHCGILWWPSGLDMSLKELNTKISLVAGYVVFGTEAYYY